MGDKINIGGDNIGGAVGRSASVVARDIAAYKNMVESATHIEPELRLKLQQAREEVEKADLSDFDKQDVAESLKRLTAELDKPERDPGVITRFWNRVQEVAPTIASILSSVASITKIVTGG